MIFDRNIQKILE